MPQRQTPLQREWADLLVNEYKFLQNRTDKKDSALNRFLASKIPDKLQGALDEAFAAAFSLIFDIGIGVIEKTYDKEALQKDYRIKHYRDLAQQDSRSLHVFADAGKKAGGKNLALSGTIGIGMGALGVGIPDIPVFTALLLKSIYEIALNYGFGYETPKERAFILMLIEAAVSYGDRLSTLDQQINGFIATGKLPEDFDRQAQIRATSGALSKELLYMKFLQGVPIVGAVGGAYDVVYMKRINEYANYKYRRRFLRGRKSQPGQK